VSRSVRVGREVGDEEGQLIATATGRQGRLQRHRIIERPRLTRLLEESKSRVLVFVAPAGFGKSTLADQWIASGGRSGAWFRARRSSTDVAALALDIARASTSVVPGCEERLREHLRAVPAAGENVEVLAEILGEDLAAWPATAWLVIDEYQEIAGAQPAERFVQALIEGCSIQIVIASRAQPSWATQRLILHGELFELTQEDLAMRQSEVAEVLRDRGAPSSTLLKLADGWPAAIGLASVSLAQIREPAQVTQLEGVHESLYRFFAEEIFGTFERGVQDGLVTLSIAPVIDRQLAAQLLGTEVGDAVCVAALGVGIMVERGNQLELHPLARSFLDERADRVATSIADIAEKCVAHYRSRTDWDAALEVITRHALRNEVVPTLEAGLDDLLETARISTIEEWCKSAVSLEVESPWISLARAEIALRQARFTEAQTHAEAAAVDESDVTFRALCVAGRAAHMASREEEAVELYRIAQAAAPTDAARRDAQWSEAVCLIDLEAPEALDVLTELRSKRIRSDPTDRIRSAGTTLAFQLKFGPLDLTEADDAFELLDAVRDPMLQTSFLSIYGGNLAASARYADALAVSSLLLDLARRLRVDFAVPFAHCTSASALAGLRNWQYAEEHTRRALNVARTTRDVYAEQIAVAGAMRVLLQQGKHEQALALPSPEERRSLPAGTAEVLASRALALACASRLSEADSTLTNSRGISSAFEPKLLATAVTAVIALKANSRAAVDRVREFVSESVETRAFDILVTVYRSVPALLRVALSHPDSRDEVSRLVHRVGDEDLADAVDRPVNSEDPRARLSNREREVLGLMEEGLTNRQVAQALFLSEATAKAHAHSIYDKLGVRSRREIAYQALLRRSNQATSAMDETDGGTGSSVL
jgi:LuxR family maltose regulon positive regulatory protein